MRIVCLGDSLTYGYGVKRASVWTALASRAMTGYEIINKGISGDTAGGMLSRFDTDVAGNRADMAFVMGGSNDIFFSGSVPEAKSNMAALVFRSLHHGIRPIVGVPLPVYEPGLAKVWETYASGEAVKRRLEEYRKWLLQFGGSFGVPVVDFWECVPADSDGLDAFYLDGIHPSEEGHGRMAALWAEHITKLTK
ncbi:GDSL-type esterase/lipase family protein [Dorea sp. D27]|uniref:GDSL-type esterase/lipase family protein n=1 Tax=Dorea sp. D27 TaxID=658665 RepID=UPI000673523F|nr:GDSL-type esterase/lipase family protein [Dorea sp. D27]